MTVKQLIVTLIASFILAIPVSYFAVSAIADSMPHNNIYGPVNDHSPVIVYFPKEH